MVCIDIRRYHKQYGGKKNIRNEQKLAYTNRKN